ncbi:hypothetical protein MAFF211271_46010 (plasmid) [Ralstonia syzygii subsp. indonesiensis]|nr:hypothetical protein MAFF211271_46010 [Ralstonia pseudosolanacearum]
MKYAWIDGQRRHYPMSALCGVLSVSDRGHRWLRQIESGQVRNIAELADREKIDRSYVSRMINLTTLAPDIQAAILNETLPEEVALFDLAADTPQCWEAQRRRIDEVVAKASANKTHAVSQT